MGTERNNAGVDDFFRELIGSLAMRNVATSGAYAAGSTSESRTSFVCAGGLTVGRSSIDDFHRHLKRFGLRLRRT